MPVLDDTPEPLNSEALPPGFTTQLFSHSLGFSRAHSPKLPNDNTAFPAHTGKVFFLIFPFPPPSPAKGLDIFSFPGKRKRKASRSAATTNVCCRKKLSQLRLRPREKST